MQMCEQNGVLVPEAFSDTELENLNNREGLLVKAPDHIHLAN